MYVYRVCLYISITLQHPDYVVFDFNKKIVFIKKLNVLLTLLTFVEVGGNSPVVVHQPKDLSIAIHMIRNSAPGFCDVQRISIATAVIPPLIHPHLVTSENAIRRGITQGQSL